jgi:hypothetical protein
VPIAPSGVPSPMLCATSPVICQSPIQALSRSSLQTIADRSRLITNSSSPQKRQPPDPHISDFRPDWEETMNLSIPKLADISIMLGCVLLLGVLASREWNSYRGKQKHEDRLTQLTGRQIMQPVGRHEAMVILQLSPDCVYCLKSIPFYRDLNSMADHSRERLFLATQFLDPEAGRNFLEANDLPGIAGLGPPQPGLSTGLVPTVLLADQSGEVVKAWTGYLKASQQRDVRSAIHTLCPACGAIHVPGTATIR